MKKLFLTMGILACMLIFGTKEVYAQTVVTLDTAINNAGKELSSKLKQGSKIAILSMSSSSMQLSTYVIEELTFALVNQRQVTVVDRFQLDLIQQEMKFQYSGEVSDASAQAIGKKLGAQSIITGSFVPLSDYYRFRVKVIEVETAVISITYSTNVQNDRLVASLMSDNVVKPSVSKAKEVKPKETKPEEVKPQVSYGDDFTTGQRWGTYFLNIVPGFGLGSSLIMQDKVGATAQLIMTLSETTLYFVAVFAVPEMAYVGLVVWGINGFYNMIRSSTYHKPSSSITSLFDPSALNLMLLPAKDGSIDKVQVLYTVHF